MIKRFLYLVRSFTGGLIMKRKIISAVLVVCMLMTCIVVANYSVTAVTTDKSKTGTTPDTYSGITANPYGMADSNDDATILQAWNWSYNNIKAELDNIGKQGFNTVQISPPNEIKEGTSGVHVFEASGKTGWWMFYQPAGFQINQSTDNALGTKADLVDMVKAAHAKGIKIIADTVINHMGTKGQYLDGNGNEDTSKTNPMDHVTSRAAEFESSSKNEYGIYSNNLFHDPYFNMTYKEDPNQFSQYDSTYDLTRGCTSYLPDLKTEDQRVQDRIYQYLQELVDCGIDGFRIDAAKHIETKYDVSSLASDFWDDTITKVKTYAKTNYSKDLLSYGEILNNCGVNRKYEWYFPYMKVTDTSVFYSITGNTSNGNAAYAIPQNMVNGRKDQTVLWNESHDTYADGNRPTETELTKRWALMASRDGITSMFLARPASDSQELGVASQTLWYSSKAVKAVNDFNNVYSGQGEYLQSGSGVAVIGRGNKTSNGGAVLVNCNSGTSKSISGLSVATLADGSYVDKVSGSTFTVSGGKVSGNIGGTGVAVLYSDDPMVGGTSSGYYTTATYSATLTYRNVDRATYSVNGGAETQYASGEKVTFGSAEDVQGATYLVTLKGYVGSEVKATATLTYTKKNQAANHTITFNTNGVSGWTSPKIYYWGGTTTAASAWPGVAMSGSGSTYTYTLPADVPNVLFTVGSGSPQTIDLTVSDDTIFTLQNSSTTVDGVKKYSVTSQPAGATFPTYYPGVEPSSFESDYEFGDVSRDGKININDVTMIQQRLVFLISFDLEQANLADFNRDGKLNIHDATAIQYKLAIS